MKGQPEGITEWMQRLRNAALKAVTEDDMREIFKSLADRAKKGDPAALKLLMTYLQPPPPAVPPQLPAQRVSAKTVNIYPANATPFLRLFRAQRVSAKTVNIYANRPSKKAKLLRDDLPRIDYVNGASDE
jgi:hypothetical protein